MKQLVHILMVIILSISIVAPSVLSIYSDHYDIEIAKDLEEESKKETKDELDREDSFFETFTTPQLATIEDVKFFHDTYCLSESSFNPKIHLPPPKHIA